MVNVICCGLSLYLFGAYSKLWRYFKKSDYVSCILGIAAGTSISCLFTYMFDRFKGIPLSYVLLDTAISIFGICLFRYIFKSAFIDYRKSQKPPSPYKRTMIIGGGRACETILN
ncbi:MAG: hypothetical protein IJ666_05620 [Ruminococcus sp.]|nr:hypothetical protein [Ruminococcus sp.]